MDNGLFGLTMGLIFGILVGVGVGVNVGRSDAAEWAETTVGKQYCATICKTKDVEVRWHNKGFDSSKFECYCQAEK